MTGIATFFLRLLFASLVISNFAFAQASVAAHYFPLQPGNTWIYDYFDATDTEQIVDEIVVDGVSYYQFSRFRGNPNTAFGYAGDRVLRYLDNTTTLWYDFGVEVGTNWTVTGEFGEQWTVTLFSKTDTIETTAGTFTKCYHFVFSGMPDNEWEEWFAPGEGIVKRVLYGIVVQQWQLSQNIITGITEEPGDQLTSFNLHQNYPNPFNPSTAIAFTMTVGANIRLTIHDLLGREVVELANGRKGPGRHAISWDSRMSNGQMSPSGIYLYRLTVDSHSRVRKMLLLR